MFVEKLNKKQEGVYVIEEEKAIVGGVWEGYLDHDNVNHETIYIYTGPKLLGEKVENYFISTPSETPWKTHLKVFSESEKIYITYETTGDQVEAEDINLVQDEIVNEIDRAKSEELRIENKLDNEIARAIAEDEKLDEEVNKRAKKTYVDTELNKRYTKNEVFNKQEVLQKIQDLIGAAPEALDTLEELARALDNDPNFATNIINLLATKVDKVAGKGLSTNDYTDEEKQKLAGIEDGANKYVHPNTHPASMITESSTKRFVTDAEKSSWNNKQDALGYTPVNKAGDTMTGDLKVNGNIVAGTEYIVGYNGTIESLQRFKFKYDGSTGYLELWRYSNNTGWTLCATFPNRNTGSGGLTVEGKQVAYKSDIPTKLSEFTKDIIFDERYYTESEIDARLSNKVDKIAGKGLSSNDYTTTEKNKLAGIEAGANKYIHPSTHPASMITESTSRRFVSDEEKALWNNKAEISDIPIKTSQLINDSGFLTTNDLVPNISTGKTKPTDGSLIWYEEI